MTGVNDPGIFPEGFTIDAVDWLPSGARSGLVRVRGHRPPAIAGRLPELILEGGGEVRRFASLPDPSADRDPAAWRGAYVLEARPAAEADRLWLEWPGGRRLALPPLSVPPHQARADEETAPASGEVVDRAVLAERRARRAEASEQAQARIAREAMRAVEVLELRSSEIEENLIAAVAERDALRDRAREAAGPDVRVEVLQEELFALRDELERRAAAPPEPEPVLAGRIPAADAERRAERLRGALAATIATVAELRLRLHEVEVARRTRDVAAGADAVRLAVVERERQTTAAALDAARVQLREARSARAAAAAALEGALAAQADLRSRHEDQSTELGRARRSIAQLETELAAARAEAGRAAAAAFEAARAEVHPAADARVGAAEAATAAAEERLVRAQAAIAGAETARELAEAAALAAAAERRAAEVAHAAHQPDAVGSARLHALQHELDDVRAELRAAAQLDPAPAPAVREPVLRVAPDLLSAAAEQVRVAAERAPAQDAERVVADLSAAAASLRSRPPIVSARDELPANIARGRAQREYPPLRGALVKLAHDDAAAAGGLIAGMLGAQHLVLDAGPDYDLTIEEVGTFAVSGAGATTLVTPLDAPRGRPQAAFHLRADALTLAEILTGVQQRPRRRRGPLRASGSVRQARRLAGHLAPDVALEDLVRAGARLDPALALRGLAYAVRPAWTRGETWAVELRVAGCPLTVVARLGGGLQVQEGPHHSEPDARVRMSEAEFRSLLMGEAPSLATEGDEQVVQRLLALADRACGRYPN